MLYSAFKLVAARKENLSQTTSYITFQESSKVVMDSHSHTGTCFFFFWERILIEEFPVKVLTKQNQQNNHELLNCDEKQGSLQEALETKTYIWLCDFTSQLLAEDMRKPRSCLKYCSKKTLAYSYPLPPRTQLSIKGIPKSINTLPPTLPGCGILYLVKNCKVIENHIYKRRALLNQTN